MKNLKIFTSMVVMTVVLFMTSCKKETSRSVIQQQPEPGRARYGGSVEDDPQFMSKVPFVISSDLLTHGPQITSTLADRGRKPKPGIDATPPTVTISSPSQGQTIDATTISVAV